MGEVVTSQQRSSTCDPASADKPAPDEHRAGEGQVTAVANDRPLIKSAPSRPHGRGRVWGKRVLAAAIIALATGVGTGLAGRAYEELKAWFFSIFASHSWTAYALEPTPNCDTYTL